MFDRVRRFWTKLVAWPLQKAAVSRLPSDERELISRIRSQNLTYLSDMKLARLASTIRSIEDAGLPGIFIEAGCALGGSAILIATLKRLQRPLFIYDVFEMIPPPTGEDTQDVHDRYRRIVEGKSKGIGGDKYYGYLENLYEIVQTNLRMSWSTGNRSLGLAESAGFGHGRLLRSGLVVRRLDLSHWCCKRGQMTAAPPSAALAYNTDAMNPGIWGGAPASHIQPSTVSQITPLNSLSHGVTDSVSPRTKTRNYGINCEERSVSLVKGLLQQTMRVDAPVAFAHVDVDWYEPVMTCLKRIFPKLVVGASMILDDYHDWGGCRKATDEFLGSVGGQYELDDSAGSMRITRIQS